MPYIVEVERNYKPFMKCIETVVVPRGSVGYTLYGYHIELAKRVEKQYNIKCEFIKVDGTLVWNTLEFKSEQDYLLWLMKYS